MNEKSPIDMIDAEEALLDEGVWSNVLSAVDRTYAELVEHQTRLEKQNAELEELRAFLVSIMTSVSDVLIVISRQGTIEECSASLCAFTGKTRKALTNLAVTSLFDVNDRQRLDDAIIQVATERKPTALELQLKAPDTNVPLDVNISAHFDERTRVAGFVLSGRPLGELRQAYAELEQSHSDLKAAQAQLVRNEKLASLGRLLAGVAHELNNPISFVYANTHALERYAGKFETYFSRVQEGASRAELIQLRENLRLDREVRNFRTAVNGAQDGAERVRDIVEDLRRLSSEGSGGTTDFDLVETTHVAVNWVLRGSDRKVSVEFEGDKALIIEGRPGHIQQVIMNLVQNALDATGDEPHGQLLIAHGVDQNKAWLDVHDNGPGITQKEAEIIFDPFYTTKDVGQGTGLGPAISHKIAEEHGGDLKVGISRLSGACFRLELPMEMTS